MLPVRDLTIFAARAEHQEAYAAALAEGLKAHGIKSMIRRAGDVSGASKYVACWGWRNGYRLRTAGHEVLVMERGYIGDRFRWTSLGWNGLNGRATFYPKDDPTRFAANFSGMMKPWKMGGAYVLLIGQVPGDASLGGMDLRKWYEDTAREAAKAYGKPVRFRPHPQAIKRNIHQAVSNAATMNGELHAAFADAVAVVTFNSNTAVESVLAGVPTVATDRGTMASDVTSRTIGDVFVPDREAWAARLAWCQWTTDEIKSGAAWAAVCPR